MIRIDNADVIYKTAKEKYNACMDEIINLHKKGQPVLVGTISIDISEALSRSLRKRKIKHTVLNAKNHEKEAEIISMAGQKGSVTISTNMAGRGTDIVLGEGVKELGGLHIIGTARHESRRIDNQLRGRSGRQGDQGSSRFYLSLEDDLLRIFGGERITNVMERLGMEEGEPIEHNLISKAIENAQSKVEGRNFDFRKQLLEYDDVMNQQREVIYQQRREALYGESLKTNIEEMIHEKAHEISQRYYDEKTFPEEFDIKGMNDAVLKQFNFPIQFDETALEELDFDKISNMISEKAYALYNAKEEQVPTEDFRYLERMIMLQTVDNLWKDHLLSMDHLKEGIGLRGYAQQNPLIVYKKEGFEMFNDMISRIVEETLAILFRIQIAEPENIDHLREPEEKNLVFSGGDGGQTKKEPVKRKDVKIGRNSPCPCGSGKKFKKCCGS